MLDIHQLNVFLTAAETLSFTQAAHRLHMSQPSVSQHIQVLEHHFNCGLFHRNGRFLELTEAGRVLMPLAREAVALSVRIDETIGSMKGEVIGHLMVGCSTTPGKYVLPHLLALFHESYPRVRVTCQVSSQQQSLKMLVDGEVHFALASVIEDFSRDLEFYRYLCDQVVMIVNDTHPWAKRQSIHPGELNTARFIMREEGSGTRAAVQTALASVGVSLMELDTLLTLGNSEAIAMAVQEGLGVGFVSKMIVDRLITAHLVPITIEGVSIHRDIYFTRNPNRPATTAQNAFWNFLLTEKVMNC